MESDGENERDHSAGNESFSVNESPVRRPTQSMDLDDTMNLLNTSSFDTDGTFEVLM